MQGHSRIPLLFRKTQVINGTKCFLYKAERNVVAKIAVELPQGAVLLYDDALVAKGESLGCMTAVIAVVARTVSPKNKDVFQEHTSHVTATHGANVWEIKHHANAKVITPRQEIMDALQKRGDPAPERR